MARELPAKRIAASQAAFSALSGGWARRYTHRAATMPETMASITQGIQRKRPSSAITSAE